MPSRQRRSTLNWRTSTYSGGHGDCVQIASAERSVLVRDAQQQSGPVLRFSAAQWSSFMKRLRGDSLSAAG